MTQASYDSASATVPNKTSVVDDTLKRLVDEIPQEMSSFLGREDVDLPQVKQFVALTLGKVIEELGEEVIALRAWAAHAHVQHANQLDDHEQRLALQESLAFGGESQLTQEDADLLAKVAVFAEQLGQASLDATDDPDGKAALQDGVDMARRAQLRIDEITVSYDEDDAEPSGATDDVAAEGAPSLPDSSQRDTAPAAASE